MEDRKIAVNPDIFALRQLANNWFWYLLLGIGLVTLGTLAVVYSFTATIFSIVYIGFLMIFSGLFEAFHSFKINKWGSFFLHLFLGILYVVVGIFIVTNPALNALTLTLFLACFLIISGIARTIMSLIVNTPHRFWLLLNGILTIILGVLIWKQWPISGFWIIGTFVGIDVIFTGLTWVMLSLKAKHIKSEVK
jgi:uncharacterized membrane protein HdeD (DUF308 family)